MTIEVLNGLTKEQYENLGHDGYESNQFYDLMLERDKDSTLFKLIRTGLKKKYVKCFRTTFEDIEVYNKYILEGNSFGAYDKGLVGLAICKEHKWNNSLYLSNLLVSGKKRQKGIGKLLIQNIIEHAKNKNIRLIELETQNTNVPAITFYQKQGFKITGLKTNLYNKDVIEKAIYMTFEI